MLAEYLQKIVENHPKAVAIVDQSLGEVTYEQLWKLIQACATNIQQKLGAERYLGLMADQDGRAIITLIATIILGKTIIPIDPRYTPSLAEEILSPYTEHLVVSSPVKNSRHLNQLTLDSLILQPPNNSVDIEYSSENNDAYILHTSGTTGKPKAVLADQKALLHVALTLKKTYHITHASRVLQFAYLSFDSSLVEIWSTLLSGGTLVIAGSELRSNMYGFLERELSLGSISIVTLPPSIANNLPVDCLSSLDTLVLAGEELPTELANRLLGKPRHLINAYGPTESIICASTYEIGSRIEGRVPIGKPLDGMKIVIDSPDSSGLGEIHLYSSYLAKCYANDSYMTSSKFKVSSSGHRFYRTGDIGRMLPGGLYEFAGRIDNQIKINGQRIELESIEATLRRITKTSDIAVIYHDEALFCFYGVQTHMPNSDILQKQLINFLPGYAVPTTYIPLNDIPLDRNGKTDRRSLLSCIPSDLLQTSSTAIYCTSASMKKMWIDVLHFSPELVQDNTSFFSLGGDSLGILRLLRAIKSSYNVDVRLSEIIKEPTTPTSMSETISAIQKDNQA